MHSASLTLAHNALHSPSNNDWVCNCSLLQARRKHFWISAVGLGDAHITLASVRGGSEGMPPGLFFFDIRLP